jgi:hypothetical protein
LNKPEYVKVNNELYKLNTDFRVAIRCNEIATDENIGDYERALAILYLLYGDIGLNEVKIQNELLEKGMKYLSLGQEQNGSNNDVNKNRLDISKCKGLIKSSFKYDYGYDPYELEYLHWYDFYNDLENLSSNEFGTCCILNRINNLLNMDLSTIKDNKQRNKMIEAQKQIIEQYCYKSNKKMTKEQENSANEFYSALFRKEM